MWIKLLNGVTCASIITVLVACNKSDVPEGSSQSNETVQTVEFYKTHQTERLAKLKDCKDRAINPMAETADAKDCRAAGKAANDIFLSKPASDTPKTYMKF